MTKPEPALDALHKEERESALTFPCVFPIKIMGRTQDGFAQSVADVVRKPMLQDMYRLMQFRNSYPAFNGEVTIGEDLADGMLHITWTDGASTATLDADFKDKSFSITVTDNGGEKVLYSQAGE